MSVLETAAQYCDWIGKADADDQTTNDIQQLLRDRGLISDGELVAAVEFAKVELDTYIHALVAPVPSFDQIASARNADGILRLRRVSVEIDPGEFFDLFKRIGFAITRRGIEFPDDQYELITEGSD